MPALPQRIPLGTVIGGRYRIDEILGEGGFGVVFKANQLALDRAVALKVLRPQAFSEDSLARFQREALIFQRLDHPNIVRLLDFGNDGPGGSPYLVFELLHGRTLEAMLRARGPLPPARVVRVVSQLLKALMEAHAQGVVHRDLKPANVFLSDFQGEPDFVKVIDFGLAKGEGARTLTQQGGVVGTVAYMAPEQADGRAVGPPADLFAVGLVLSEMVSGRPVFAGYDLPGVVATLESPDPIPHRPEALASLFGAVIRRATEKVVDQRYASAREMLADLEAIPLPASPRASDPVGLPVGPPLVLARPAGAPVSDGPGPSLTDSATLLLDAGTTRSLTPFVVPPLGPPVTMGGDAPNPPPRAIQPPAVPSPAPLIPPTRIPEAPVAAPVPAAAVAPPRAPTVPMEAVPAPPSAPRAGSNPISSIPVPVPESAPRSGTGPSQPAPPPELPRRRSTLRSAALATVGGLLLAAAVIGAMEAIGMVDLGLPSRRAATPVHPSAVASVAPAPVLPLVWGSLRSELEIAEIDANGDGVLDFAGYCGEEGKGRTNLCMVDGATFQILWRRPLAAEISPEHHLGAAGHAVVGVDPRGVAHLYDAATGTEQGSVSLGGRAAIVCSPTEMPEKVWIRLRDRPPAALDVATRATSEVPRPPSCVLGPGEQLCNGYRPDMESCLTAASWPRFADLSPLWTHVEGGWIVALGSRSRDQSVPMILGGSPPPREGGDIHVRWSHPLAPGDGLSALHATFFLALRGGRAVSWYEHAAGKPHIVAVEASGGKTLWDVATTEVMSLHLTLTRLYVQHRQGLDVREAPTGKLLGSVKPP